MKLGFVFDCGFDYYNGHYYAINLTQKLWKERYLPFFDEIVVVGRHVDAKESPVGKLSQSDCDRVSFRCMPNQPRAKRMLTQAQEGKFIEKAIADCDAVICRTWWGTAQCRKLGKPYMIEVVNCVWDSLWNHSRIGKVAALPNFLLQKKAIRQAPYVLYVTQEFLQNRYPTEGKQVGVSDVEIRSYLSEQEFKQRRFHFETGEKIILGSVGAVNMAYKGHQYVIEALGKLKKEGITNYEYHIVGSGDQTRLHSCIRENDVEDCTFLDGPIPHDQIMEWYDTIDIYLQPSLTEGLPRTVVEAMSRGLPCMGSDAGGIPELIGRKYVCRKNGDLAEQFAQLLKRVTPEELSAASERNFREAKKYEREILDSRRKEFFQNFVAGVQKKDGKF